MSSRLIMFLSVTLMTFAFSCVWGYVRKSMDPKTHKLTNRLTGRLGGRRLLWPSSSSSSLSIVIPVSIISVSSSSYMALSIGWDVGSTYLPSTPWLCPMAIDANRAAVELELEPALIWGILISDKVVGMLLSKVVVRRTGDVFVFIRWIDWVLCSDCAQPWHVCFVIII